MRRSSIVRSVLAVIILAGLAHAGPVHAAATIGASFGYTRVSYPDAPGYSNDVIGLPGASAWGQPGLRVAYLSPDGRWNLLADFGLVSVHRSGSTGTDEETIEALPQFQVSAPAWQGFSPFVNAGVGVVREAVLTAYGDGFSTTRPVFGGGLGVRRAVSEGHGFIREEFHYEQLPARTIGPSKSYEFTFPATNLYSLKLGFDLQVAR